MKSFFSFVLLFFLSFHQVVACWWGPEYEGSLCREYTWSYEREEQTPEEIRVAPYRERMDIILDERLDLTQKDDYEVFLKLKNKVENILESGVYSGDYKDLLCALHIELDERAWSFIKWGFFLNIDTVLVEENIDGDRVNLYALSVETGKSEKLYSEVQKISDASCEYHNEDNILYNFFQTKIEIEYGVDSNKSAMANPFIYDICEQEDITTMSFSYYRWEDEWLMEKQYSWWWGIKIFKNLEENFSAAWDLAFPNGDVDIFQPAYIIDSDNIIIQGSSCWYKMVKKLENGASQAMDILSE